MSINFYQTTRRHMSEDCTLHFPNLKVNLLGRSTFLVNNCFHIEKQMDMAIVCDFERVVFMNLADCNWRNVFLYTNCLVNNHNAACSHIPPTSLYHIHAQLKSRSLRESARYEGTQIHRSRTSYNH
jgi:hypothetical protein